MFRNGVNTECPDGTRWISVPSPKNSEVRSASCSAIGVLWIVLEDGGAAVRYGITSQCLTGWLTNFSSLFYSSLFDKYVCRGDVVRSSIAGKESQISSNISWIEFIVGYDQ